MQPIAPKKGYLLISLVLWVNMAQSVASTMLISRCKLKRQEASSQTTDNMLKTMLCNVDGCSSYVMEGGRRGAIASGGEAEVGSRTYSIDGAAFIVLASVRVVRQ